MHFPTEQHLPHIRPADLRYYQASYFFEKFKEGCGSEEKRQVSSFHWITYSDAFLMALASLQDFMSGKQRDRLLKGAYRT
jgi:hypothetical protein